MLPRTFHVDRAAQIGQVIRRFWKPGPPALSNNQMRGSGLMPTYLDSNKCEGGYAIGPCGDTNGLTSG